MWDKVMEEIAEFREAVQLKDKKEMQNEYGDIIFALVNIARFFDIYPEEALQGTNRKFAGRFQYIEQCIKQEGKQFADYTLEQLDQFWNEAKTKGL